MYQTPGLMRDFAVVFFSYVVMCCSARGLYRRLIILFAAQGGGPVTVLM